MNKQATAQKIARDILAMGLTAADADGEVIDRVEMVTNDADEFDEIFELVMNRLGEAA